MDSFPRGERYLKVFVCHGCQTCWADCMNEVGDITGPERPHYLSVQDVTDEINNLKGKEMSEVHTENGIGPLWSENVFDGPPPEPFTNWFEFLRHCHQTGIYSGMYISKAGAGALAYSKENPDLGTADVWHQGTHSFYSAKLLKKLTAEEAHQGSFNVQP